MPYDRVRDRNGLRWRPVLGEDPYPREQSDDVRNAMLCGDLNRMEADYLAPVYPQDEPQRGSGFTSTQRERGSSPAEVCARETGIDVETVRRVLAHVFGREVPR